MKTEPLYVKLIAGLALAVAFSFPFSLLAQNDATGQSTDASAMNWPRTYTAGALTFAVYQPQITDWPSNELYARSVVGVQETNGSPTFGVVFYQARTDIDKLDRLVTLEDIQITKVKFPTQSEMESQYLATLKSFQKQTMRVIPLDHLEAVFAASGAITKTKIQSLKNDPPQIIYSTQPSLLVRVDGPPVLQPLVANYQRVVNTRAILLMNSTDGGQTYYLYAANNWYSASAIQGPWSINFSPPLDIDSALGAALATKQVDPMAPTAPNMPAPQNIYVSLKPAELIQTTGQANLLSIPGTSLLYVANTSSALLFYLNDASYYVLISGRWFKSPALTGPWAFESSKQLPTDFKNIPPDSDKGAVLASVAGTPQAQEAVIENSIPQTATILRNQASLNVNYAGAPGFASITGTALNYATNSDTPVVMIDSGNYYACQEGVWFTAGSPTGPWQVATSVPQVVYTIPPSSPIYYVTYAYTYGASGDDVYVGYAPGYTGTVVGDDGTVVYGTGYDYPTTVVGNTWYASPATYGYGAALSVSPVAGYEYGFTSGYAPYWGCYHYGAPAGCSYAHVNVNGTSCYSYYGGAAKRAYNPATGATAYSAKGAAYNPYTGGYAAGKQAAGYNPATGNYGATSKGVAGNANSGEAAGYNRGVVGNTETGNKAAWDNGTMYADKNGDVYRYSPSTGAQQYSGGNWQAASKPATANVAQYNSAQNLGAQRYDNYQRGGGNGWHRR
jgi:hypothetical protein